jgi:transcriptional regulator NrdR family protein
MSQQHGAQCPICKSRNTDTIETRTTGSAEVRRRKHCQNCGHRFTTYEISAEIYHGMPETVGEILRGVVAPA